MSLSPRIAIVIADDQMQQLRVLAAEDEGYDPVNAACVDAESVFGRDISVRQHSEAEVEQT